MTAYLFFNGPIVTMAKGETSPESLVTHEGRIAFTGPRQEALDWAHRHGVNLTEHDLEGQALLPGFIDPHLHPMPMIFFAMNADLEHARDLAEVKVRLTSKLADLSEEEWLMGVQFEAKSLPAGEQLTRRELDGMFPGKAVLIYSRDGHSVIVNTKALDAAGIKESVEAPYGGVIGRYQDGSLNGIFEEKAIGLPMQHFPSPRPERMLAASQGVFDQLAEAGITSIGAMLQSDEEGPGGASSRMEALLFPQLRGLIPQSVYAIIIGKTMEGIKSAIESPLNDPDQHTVTRAFKIFADGTFGSCTACMTEPYADKTCSHGYMTLSDDEIYARMEAAHLAGYQVCIHAIGDKGIENCVRLFERLLDAHPRPGHRHRIEHASIASKDLVARIAKAGLSICTQPLFIRSESDWLPRRLGEARAAQAYPFRDFIDAGIVVAGSSDAPIESTDVVAALDFAVNRGGFHPEQGISIEDALAMYTRNAAWLQFEEDLKGTLEHGKQADLVILNADPLSVSPQEIAGLKVRETIIRGEFVSR